MEIESENEAEPFNMGSLNSYILKTYIDFEKFNHHYCSKHETVPIEHCYLRSSDLVKVFQDIHGQWQAGYVINSKNSLRYLGLFDNYIKNIIFRDKRIREEQFVEITCIWINPSLTKTDKSARLKVYENAVKDAQATQKQFIMGGSKIFSVWRTFQTILPNELYFGLVPFPDGMELGKIVYEDSNEALKRMEEYLCDFI